MVLAVHDLTVTLKHSGGSFRVLEKLWRLSWLYVQLRNSACTRIRIHCRGACASA